MNAVMADFLSTRDPRPWTATGFPPALTPARLFAQGVPNGLEVVVAQAGRRPRGVDLRQAWEKRRAGRASPVLLIVFYPSFDGQRVSLYGPLGDQPPRHGIEVSQAERIAEAALGEPDHHAATRFLLATLPEADSPLPGLRNVGLLATQELQAGVPRRQDWPRAVAKSRSLLVLRGRRLMEALGFGVEPLSSNASMLTINGAKRAVAVFCHDDEPFEAPALRFHHVSPVSRALAVANRENVDWVVLTRSSEIRLYAARLDTGLGGRPETFVELNLALLPENRSGYLHLLFSSEALADEGTIESILANSRDFAASLATRLRDRVYRETVPQLAKAVAERIDGELKRDSLDYAYEQAMVILFRLLFVAYAEDKNLLPYRTNRKYFDHSLSLKARRLTEDRQAGRERYDPTATDLWDDIHQLWRAIDQGNIGWGVPAYDGGLFSTDPEVSRAGAALARLRLTDQEFGPALSALLIDKGPEGVIGPVDFRTMSAREFGTIYEGLLESRLSVAQDDLAAKVARGEEQLVPAKAGDDVEVKAGTVYVHNRSGVRKATGSYFTRPFAVEHLLDQALAPALNDHIARLDSLYEADDQATLAEAFFDFRCADIAMGSGHFLVAALDRIEARLSEWLDRRPIPAVIDQLARLRRTAMKALGDLSEGIAIETGSLLRRQVARHCVYGVDKNQVAVELARLAVWVHTFVPGLPLSFLDHNFVQGDSLPGVGSLSEVVGAFDPDADPDAPSLFRSQLEELLAAAEGALARLARTSDATKREIDEARAAHREALRAVADARTIFDVVTAVRAGACELPENFDMEAFNELRQMPTVDTTVRMLNPVHFPAVWPEVFLRKEPGAGFDCVIGNPPWEKVVVDREVWWGLHLPGVRSLPVSKRRARINQLERERPDLAAEFLAEKDQAEDYKRILRKTFPRLGSGQTDLYKAFSWANLAVIREGGLLGIVLPRSAVSDAGMANWRRSIVQERERERESKVRVSRMSVATVINHKGWAFEGIHNSYTVALVAVTRSSPLSPASTPSSGHSAVSTADTQWRSSQLARSTLDAPPGGGFEDGPNQPYVAIYPGPASSRHHFEELIATGPELVPISEFTRWSNTAAFPQIPTRPAFRVWRKMKQHPRFDGSDLARFTEEREREREREKSGSGGSARFKAISTPQSIDIGSDGTTDMAPPSSGGTPCHPRQKQIHERRWRLRPVRELDATHDRSRFMKDDGVAARGQR
ncbi:MAG: hypothetical protein OXS33_02350 [bacterium]|nr:hypothetical protein [bacterium]